MKKINENVNISVNGKLNESEEDADIIVDKEKAKNANKTVINEAVPLEDTVVVNGNIYAGNIIRGEVTEIDCGEVIRG